jgi:hypothetical protein
MLSQKNNLIATLPLEKIIETAIYTGHLHGVTPVSLMLVGPSGAGKSRMLLKFSGDMLHRSDDLTSSGLQAVAKGDEKEQKITHIVLPDFNAPLSHKASTSQLLVANLLTIMSDGTTRIDDGRDVKTVVHNPIGILTGCTPDMFSRNESKWKALGFTRRFLPLFYDYSLSTIQKVQDAISSGKITSLPLTVRPILFKGPKAKIYLNSREANHLQNLSLTLAQLLAIYGARKEDENGKAKFKTIPGKPLLPYSPHHILQAFAKGNALKNGRIRVTKADVEFCTDVLEFCRYGEPKRL